MAPQETCLPNLAMYVEQGRDVGWIWEDGKDRGDRSDLTPEVDRHHTRSFHRREERKHSNLFFINHCLKAKRHYIFNALKTLTYEATECTSSHSACQKHVTPPEFTWMVRDAQHQPFFRVPLLAGEHCYIMLTQEKTKHRSNLNQDQDKIT